MKIIKKYCKDSSRGREVGWGRGRPQTHYLNLNRTEHTQNPYNVAVDRPLLLVGLELLE